MMLRHPVSVKSALGENPKRVYGDKGKLPSTRQGVAAVIRDELTKAQDYLAKKSEAEKDGKAFERNNTLEILGKVLGL